LFRIEITISKIAILFNGIDLVLFWNQLIVEKDSSKIKIIPNYRTKFKPNFILIDFEQKLRERERERTPDKTDRFRFGLLLFFERCHATDKTFHYVKFACMQKSIQDFRATNYTMILVYIVPLLLTPWLISLILSLEDCLKMVKLIFNTDFIVSQQKKIIIIWIFLLPCWLLSSPFFILHKQTKSKC
jgi:hypothetical protein